jgi:hypothetical protein
VAASLMRMIVRKQEEDSEVIKIITLLVRAK